MGGFFNKIKADKTDLFLSLATLTIFVALIYSPIKPKKFGDNNFHTETQNLVNMLFANGDWNEFYIEKAPGPDFYYLIPYSFVGVSGDEHHYWLSGIIWNVVFMVLAVLLVKRIATELFGRKAGIFSGILMLIFPIHIYYAMGINGESMAYISFILLLYGGLRWTRYGGKGLNSKAWWCLLGGSVSLILVRLNFVVIVPLIVIFLLATVKVKNVIDLRRGLLLYSFLIVLFAVIIRVSLDHIPGNKGKHFHDKYSAYVLHLGRFQFREEPWDWRFWQRDIRGDSKDYISWQDSRKSLTQKMENEGRLFHQVYNEWILDDYTSHPFMTLRQFLVKAVYGNIFIVNSFKQENFTLGPLKNKTGYFIFHFFVNSVNLFIIIGFLGFVWQNKKQMLSTYWLMGIVFLSFIGFYALTYMEPRYLFPLRVLYIITASEFWLTFLRKRINSSVFQWI